MLEYSRRGRRQLVDASRVRLPPHVAGALLAHRREAAPQREPNLRRPPDQIKTRERNRRRRGGAIRMPLRGVASSVHCPLATSRCDSRPQAGRGAGECGVVADGQGRSLVVSEIGTTPRFVLTYGRRNGEINLWLARRSRLG